MGASLSELIACYAQAGQVAWIGLRPARRAPMTVAAEVMLREDGLDGDRARPGKRAVSLFQMEHLLAIAGYLGRTEAVDPLVLRRNIGVAGVNLAALRGREVCLGPEAVVRITGPCAPCSRMEEAFGNGGYSAVRGHGGMVAEVVRPGVVGLGAMVIPRPD
jgi:MOSC domain-containing protein YiiM